MPPPHRVGVCLDLDRDDDVAVFLRAMQLALDEALESGRLVRPVELVTRRVHGPPTGVSVGVLAAYRALAYDEDVVAIVGPQSTDGSMAVRDEAGRAGVPTISSCASPRWAGEHCYSLPIGATPDGTHLLAAYLHRAAIRRVGVLHDDGTAAAECRAELARAARRYGLDVVSDQPADPPWIEARLDTIRRAGAECLVVLAGDVPLAGAVDELWRASGDRDLRCLTNEDPPDGWIGLRHVHPDNPVVASVLDRCEAAVGHRPESTVLVASGYDHGRVVAEALSTMKPPSPKAFERSLELVRMVDAAVGAPETKISFGPFDHFGYKGEHVVLVGADGATDLSWADLLRLPAEAMPDPRPRQGPMPSRDPYRIGFCQDFGAGTGDRVRSWWNACRLGFDEAHELGLLDRPVEIVAEELPTALHSPHEAVHSIRRLVEDEHCIAIVGPHYTDAAIVAREEIARLRVPAVSNTSTILWCGEWCFAAPNGTFLDETFFIARHLVRRGVRSVGVVHEDNPIGDEYFDFFRRHARRLGLSIVADETVSGIAATVDECAAALESIRRAGAEAVAHMGIGAAFGPLTEVVAAAVAGGWDVPRATIATWVNISGVTHSPTPWNRDRDLSLLEGWVGVDLVHEGNERFRALLDRYEARFGERFFSCYTGHHYDLAWLLALGLADARPATREGLRAGLERVHMFPATIGAPGTVLTFGPHDHRGYKGPDYVVVRWVQGGVEGPVDDLGEANFAIF